MTTLKERETDSEGGRETGKDLIVGIDTGGTFTDIVVLHPDGAVTIDKSATTPQDFAQGVINAVQTAADALDMSSGELLARTQMFKHGTTVATNALITRRGPRIGLITTRGFEDTVFVMRAIGRVDGLDEMEVRHGTAVTKPIPLVKRRDIRGIFERIDFRGEVVVPLDEESVRETVRELVEGDGIEAIAVSLLFSWMNPAHELRIAEIVEEVCPDRDVRVTLSHLLAPQMGEYSRSNTALADSFIGGTIERYVSGLGRALRDNGLEEDLMVMQANGGIVRPDQMTGVGSLQSGPAGGMIATKFVAEALGHPNVITGDMGGTSFDVGLLAGYKLAYAREPITERFRLLQPMIDVQSIGAGGGTIARIDPITGRLLVGPDSAGADPGPICYAMGGAEVTVTDVNLILGYLDPKYFLGGRRSLDKAAAEGALSEKIAGPLGMSMIEAAAGIYDVINSKMSDLIRRQVVRAGYVPEDFVIYAFGGAGPVHAAAYGAELGVQQVYVFPMSPVFSAFGIAAADVVHTTVLTRHFLAPVDMDSLYQEICDIEDGLAGIMRREGFSPDRVSFKRTLFMRYTRQVNEVGVEIPGGKLGPLDRTRIEDLFNARYEELFGAGAGYAEAGIEVISIAIDAIGATVKPTLLTYPETGEDASGALKGTRRAWFTGANAGWRDAAVYDCDGLKPGNLVHGPAIIETPFTTIVVPEARRAEVDKYLNVVLKR
ncbi:MAG: hydantoinase/oxoprolinase family protein [Alphaproteobacteria bacterium]